MNVSIIENYVIKFGEICDSLLFFNITGVERYKMPFLIFWLAFGGLFFSIKYKFLNIREFLSVFHFLSIKRESQQEASSLYSNKNTSSSRKIILTSIGEAIDVSAIFGIAAGIMIGGPGVLFWVLIGGILAMPLRFTEVVLSHATRIYNKKNSTMIGGPERYITILFAAIKHRRLGKYISALFSVSVIISTFFSLQVNQTMGIIRYIYPDIDKTSVLMPALLIGSVFLILYLGFRKLTVFASKIVQFMCVVYIISCILIIIQHGNNFIPSLQNIVSEAFSFKAIEGSLLFVAVTGLKRLFFSCDTGQGVSSIPHVNSVNRDSITEGIMSMASIVIITLIIIFCSGMIVVITGAYKIHLQPMDVIIAAFDSVSPILKYSLFIVVPMFAFTTLISWAYFGKKCFANLFGERYVFIYSILLAISYFVCATTHDLRLIMGIADALNLFISVPNMLALIIGSDFVARKYKKYKEINQRIDK